MRAPPAIPLFFAAVLLASCGKSEETPPLPPRPVITFAVKAPSTEIVRRFSGQLEAADGAGISFEVNGRVVEVAAKAGTRYKAGEALARIDESDYRNQLRDAEATLTNARKELGRISRLFENGNASQTQLDAATADERSARANADIARKAVENCTLKMPYDGVISSVEVKTQQVVGSGTTVMSIQGESGLEFEIGVPTEQVSNVKTGMMATVRLGVLPEDAFDAVVSEIATQVADNTTYPVTLKLADGSEEKASIRPGMDGEAALTLPNPNGASVRIPSASVATAPDGTRYVWIVTAGSSGRGTVTRREVQPADLAGEGMIRITSGLEQGEVVVSRGVYHLVEGAEVGLPK